MRFHNPLGLFSVVWAVGAALHYLEQKPLAGLAIYPFVILLCVFPARIWAIAAFATVHAALLYSHLPAAANHSVLALLVDTCLLIGCAKMAWTREPVACDRRLWETISGPLRATLAIVYLFTIFHKLNGSFFDPAVSCATSQILKMFSLHGLRWAPDPVMFAPSITITLIAETAILILLFWPRYAHVGACIGLVFHTALGWAHFFDFATVAFALYLFCFPWDGLERSLARVPRWCWGMFVVCLLAIVVTSFYYYGIRPGRLIHAWPRWNFNADTLICAFWTLMIWPVLLPIFARRDTTTGARARGSLAAAWAIPLIALLNGITPYIGLKTVANYSMFSNLRTEGGWTNHYLVPAGRFFVADYQTDLARVNYIKAKGLERESLWQRIAGADRSSTGIARWQSEVPGARIPFMELRRTLQLWKRMGYQSVRVEYEREGKEFIVRDAFQDAALMQPLTFWERKFMSFRAVQEDGEPCRCRW